MSLALALLLAAVPQEAPAATADEYEEIVVQAKVGRVALIFDKAADGRLINCRVFVSSGTRRIDDKACNSLPDCITSTTGSEYCGKGGTALVAVEPKSKPPAVFGLGVTIKPEAPKKPAVGPAVIAKEDDDPNRLGKLPPPPKADNGPPAITFSGPQVEEPK
ncbi:hypothetical protein M9978_03950 [Sphingomonas sp. MG17]|uniref:Energy transducer TonB n=1 Tax=Sphingomonas tagetis TaxID=2949092 RepID=A0A9X2HLP3_9SPHN|nr:hypothetical protein [Sphingomonas tagetis]MCP3729573.1 hypothetical protein [Sphingomonas tagetis]